jgi:hypothetical protein
MLSLPTLNFRQITPTTATSHTSVSIVSSDPFSLPTGIDLPARLSQPLSDLIRTAQRPQSAAHFVAITQQQKDAMAGNVARGAGDKDDIFHGAWL